MLPECCVFGPYLKADIMTGRNWHERCRGTIRHAMGFGEIRFSHNAPHLGRCSHRVNGTPTLLRTTSSASVS